MRSSRIATLIRRFEQARKTHTAWATKQRKRRTEGKKPIPYVGSETHHRRWAKVYTAAIRLLKAN